MFNLYNIDEGKIRELALQKRAELPENIRQDSKKIVEYYGGSVAGDYDKKGITGYIEARPDTFVIHLNPECFVDSISGEPQELKKNFTLAHLLAHLFLHIPNERTDIIEFYELRKGRSNYTIEEHEADLFAAWLLMPYNEILKDLRYANWNISVVAKEYKVSNGILFHWCRTLGIFS